VGGVTSEDRMTMAATLPPELPHRAGLRNVFVMSVAVFALIAGEQLWSRFMPEYLKVLGAPAIAIGLWGSGKDFLDAVLQYPGGRLSDHIGSQRALMLFTAIAGLGYLAYAFAPTWLWLFAGLVLASAWGSLASPAMFALVAESLPPGRRARGFMIQSTLRRVPMLFAPIVGGWLIQRMGMTSGLRLGFAISVGLALVTLVFQRLYYRPPTVHVAGEMFSLGRLWRGSSQALRRLLVADVLARAAESAGDVFVVIYALNVLHAEPILFGSWIALQYAVSIVSYFPGAWVAERFGRKLPVVFTFVMFAAFPLAVAFARGTGGMILAFVFAGLREFGEPARKSLIADSSPANARAQMVGAYYFARSTLILPMGLLGGFLWARDPHATFVAAAIFGAVGVVWFTLAFREAPPLA
jgi:MFS family permease